MPAISSGKVLVTGANGYIAAWVVRTLLKEGYSVRGTVRSESKATHLRKVFASYGDRFEAVIVEDITAEGAFDAAVVGVGAIAHTASPVFFSGGDPNDLIVPAVHGTTRVLESALAHGATVQRVVFTSSTAAVMHGPPRTFSEADWNDEAVEEVREKGSEASPAAKYRASKVLAERAAWGFVEENKAKIGWDLIALNPPFVFGPPIQEVGAPETLNSSMIDWFQSVLGAKQPAIVGASWIDVRDLAQAHVLAIKKEAAGGERIIVSGGSFKWQDIADLARENGVNVPAKSFDHVKTTQLAVYDKSKAVRLLGLTYRSIKESTRDIVEDFKARGWA